MANGISSPAYVGTRALSIGPSSFGCDVAVGRIITNAIVLCARVIRYLSPLERDQMMRMPSLW